ncbi:MAG TPA: cytochrome c peroxidase [Polyangia bacterium]|nr:cytochrome c peroxidase [Polyangia bacterium]
MLLLGGFVQRTFVPRNWLFAIGALVSLTGCHAVDSLFCSGAGCEWTKEEWTRVQSLAALCDTNGLDSSRPCDPYATVSDPAYALMPPIDKSNAVQRDNADALELGWRMYFDTRFSGNATLVDSIGRSVPYARAASGQPTGLMCATCHDPRRAGSDFTSAPNTVSIGAGWYDVNGQQTVNAAFYDLLYWNGRSDSLWSQASAVSESGVSMNGDRLNTFWTIVSDMKYAELYDKAFPDTPLPATLPKRADVAAMLVTAADQTADPTLAVGECKRVGGMCPTEKGCIETDGACWPTFPLHGRPGRRAGCETRTPAKPAEPFGDAYDCVAGTTVDGKSVGSIVTQVLVNFGKAIAAYENKLISLESPFDRFVHEGKDSTAISPAAKRGARLFVGKASCIDCHNGPLLTDKGFHDIGIPQVGDHVPTRADCYAGNASCDCESVGKDDTCLPSGAWAGLWKLALPSNRLRRDLTWGDKIDGAADTSLSAWYCGPVDQSLKGAWRTPSLRDVAITAPYMHNGYYRTLEDVVWHYNNGGAASGSDAFREPGGTTTGQFDGVMLDACHPPDPAQQTPAGRAAQIKPLSLTAEETTDLVEFLKTLGGKPLYPDYVAAPPAAPPPDAGTPDGPASSDAGTDAGTD